LLLLLQALFYGAGHLGAPQWTSLMRDLVSERRRGRYFGYRTRRTTIMSFTALIAAGLILHGFDTRGQTVLGFATIFLIACLARLVSVYHLSYLREPAAGSPIPDLHIRDWINDLRASGALTFSAFFVCMNFAVAIASPLFAVYMLRE